MTNAHIDIGTHAPDAPGAVVVAVSGEVDLAVHDTLLESLQSAIKTAEMDGASKVVVDLSLTSFLDSTGIRVLVKSCDAAAAVGIDFSVIGARGLVRQVLEVTGVLKALAGDNETPAADLPS